VTDAELLDELRRMAASLGKIYLRSSRAPSCVGVEASSAVVTTSSATAPLPELGDMLIAHDVAE
jgi:hypothetical protein